MLAFTIYPNWLPAAEGRWRYANWMEYLRLKILTNWSVGNGALFLVSPRCGLADVVVHASAKLALRSSSESCQEARDVRAPCWLARNTSFVLRVRRSTDRPQYAVVPGTSPHRGAARFGELVFANGTRKHRMLRIGCVVLQNIRALHIWSHSQKMSLFPFLRTEGNAWPTVCSR